MDTAPLQISHVNVLVAKNRICSSDLKCVSKRIWTYKLIRADLVQILYSYCIFVDIISHCHIKHANLTSCENLSVLTPSRIWSADVSAPSALLHTLELKSKPVHRSASMAAKYFYWQGFLLLLFNFISTAALEKRFSDFKRCADEECSSKFAGLLLKRAPRDFKDASSHHPDATASHKLRLISGPVANRYLRTGHPPAFLSDAV